MASIRTAPNASNVLLVTGRELRHDSYRPDLRKLLYAASEDESPVRRGTHHFWITWFTPTTDGGEYDAGDMDARPARLRGVVRMGSTPNDTEPGTMQRQLRTMLEEIGHHWLVPSELDFGSGVHDRLATTEEWTAHFNEGAPLEGVPLFGRGNLHWNSYLQADASPLDGQWWTEEPREGPLSRWVNRAREVATLRLPSFDPVVLSTAFSDLDLSIMGLMDPAAAYPNDDNQLRWMEPQFVAPLEYRVGLCVCESNSSVLVFGYDQDHRALSVVRIDGNGVTTLETARPKRFPSPPLGVALRIVRRGDFYHFQARADGAVGAHLAPEPRDIPGSRESRIRGAFDDLATIPRAEEPVDLSEFRTIASVRSQSRPVAVGPVVERWERRVFVEAGFFNLEVRDGRGRETVHTFSTTPPVLLAGSRYDAAGADPRLHLPENRAIVRSRGRGVLLITAPYDARSGSGFTKVESFALSASDDRAPKLLVEPPSGDFTAVTSLAITRSCTLPWAAGELRNRTAWGHVHRVPMARMRLPAESSKKQLRAGRPATMRCAFVVCASDDDDLGPEAELAGRIDVLRRYFDLALPRASRGLLHAETTL